MVKKAVIGDALGERAHFGRSATWDYLGANCVAGFVRQENENN